MILNKQKQGISPLIGRDEKGLRKTIPLKLSTFLKNETKKTERKNTLLDVTQIYQNQINILTNKPKTPLIKPYDSKKRSSVLFVKNPRSTINLFQNDETTEKVNFNARAKQSDLYRTQILDDQEQRIDSKMMELVSMIKEDDKKQLQRCKSSIAFHQNFFNEPRFQDHSTKKNINNQIILPEPIMEDYSPCKFLKNRSGSFSLLTKTQTNKTNSKEVRTFQKYQMNNSYIESECWQIVTNKRLTSYTSNKKTSIPQYRLCINCQSYVEKSLISQHEADCLGFKIILKMSNNELVEFLSYKIKEKLCQLKQVEEQIKQAKEKSQNLIYTMSLYKMRSKTDKILTDLDAIRLKALKKFHSK